MGDKTPQTLSDTDMVTLQRRAGPQGDGGACNDADSHADHDTAPQAASDHDTAAPVATDRDAD